MNDQQSLGSASADVPSPSSYLKITTVGPTTVEAQGTVPMICVVGILAAVVTSYIAAHGPVHYLAWFLGVAVAELALAGTVIYWLTGRGRRRVDRVTSRVDQGELPVRPPRGSPLAPSSA